MLKLYVDTMIRLNGSARSVKERFTSEEGFVSAETIGLAVAGVLVVGIIFAVFEDNIGTMTENMLTSITDWGE